MSDREALLAAIRMHPDEDTPRLVFADWLDEHGEEFDGWRAAFIRGQIAGARPKLHKWMARKWFAILPRDFEIRKGKYLWFHELPHASASIVRGFIERVRCTAADWLANADTILAEHPVRRVRLTTWPEQNSYALNRWALGKKWPGIEFELPPAPLPVETISTPFDFSALAREAPRPPLRLEATDRAPHARDDFEFGAGRQGPRWIRT